MKRRRTSALRLVGYTLLAVGMAGLAWVCFLGFALRDGVARGAVAASAGGTFQAFLVDAWPMLLLGLLVALTGLLVLWRTGQHT